MSSNNNNKSNGNNSSNEEKADEQQGDDSIDNEITSFLNEHSAINTNDEIRSFFTIWIFITRIPAPPVLLNYQHLHPGYLMKGMCYFPVIGSIIGVIAGIVYDLVRVALQLSPTVSATISTCASIYVTGCFHEDGLADTADGFGGGYTRQAIFRIMSDSRIGTYGCAILVLYLLIKIQLLSSLDEDNNESSHSYCCWKALVVSHTLARLSAPYLIHFCDYVDDPTGPKTSFYKYMVRAKFLVSRPRVLLSMVYSFGITYYLFDNDDDNNNGQQQQQQQHPMMIALLSIVTVWLVSHFAGKYATSILGGVMGDYLGATICITEVLILALLNIMLLQQQPSTTETESSSSEEIVTISSYLVNTLVSNLKEEASCTNYSQWHYYQSILDTIQNNERIRVLLQFVLLVCGMMAWCSLSTTTKVDDDSKEEDKAHDDDERATQQQSTTKEADNDPRDLLEESLASPDSTFASRYESVQTFVDTLAKPVGSLGTFEEWTTRIAALQGTLRPSVDNVACIIFAADHGVAAAPEDGGEGCSLYPQAVSRSILNGIKNGVAGASVLAKNNNVPLRVVDVGVIGDDPAITTNYTEGAVAVTVPAKLSNGTRSFCKGPAMSTEECESCICAGRDSLIEYLEETSSKVVVFGEFGIGNTTTSSTLVAALTGQSVDSLCGGGAFASREIDNTAVSKKIAIVKKALKKHNGTKLQAADALAKLGGAEIAALVGAMLEASERDVAVLVDGFIVTAAALVAVHLSPNVCRVLFFTTQSAEKGQQAAVDVIRAISKKNNIPVPSPPALSMALRMGEGTGALLAVPILRSTPTLLRDMATIQEILASS